STYSLSSVVVGDVGNFDCIVAGTCSLTATSSIVSLTVSKALVSAVLTPSANPSPTGSSLSLTNRLTVTAPGSGTPTGNTSYKDGSAPLGTVALNASAFSVLTLSTLSHGSHLITAEYAGDTNYQGTTNSLNLVINTAPVAGNDAFTRTAAGGLKV